MTEMDWVRSADFVGRRTEQRELADFLDRVATGDGGVVLLAGEPGIGKSRLAQEAADNASRIGFTIAWGRCRESEGAPPLWPWIQVFRQLHLSPLTPDVEADAPADAARRFRLFQAVTERLVETSRLDPLLIVLDDVHRSDELSLRLLGFVGEQIPPARIGVIATYRSDEIPDGRSESVIANLAAQRPHRSIALPGLGIDDVRQWLARTDSRTADSTVVKLQERTGGNPLFLTEMVRRIQDGWQDDIPPTVRALIGERIARLPRQTRDLLEMAAILGRDFGYAPLAAALRSGPLTVVQDLEPAVRAAIVLHDPARQGGYRFSHMLLREAVIDAVDPARRAELHAMALVALQDTGWVAASELAHHAERARLIIGDEAAAEFAAAAADRALAWEDAAAWWQTALDLAPHRPGSNATRMRLGHSLRRAGRITASRAAFVGVPAHAQEVGDDAALAEAALATGDTIAEVAADRALIALLDAALARPAVAADVRVRLLARRAMAAYWSPDERAGDAQRRSAAAVSSSVTTGLSLRP